MIFTGNLRLVNHASVVELQVLIHSPYTGDVGNLSFSTPHVHSRFRQLHIILSYTHTDAASERLYLQGYKWSALKVFRHPFLIDRLAS